MFIPLFDSRIKNAKTPYVNWLIILVCVLIYAYQYYLNGLPRGDELLFFFTYKFAVIPEFVSKNIFLSGLFTYIFLHSGGSHILFNMLYLFIFGDNMEATLGRIGYFLFFLFGGVVAALTHVYFNPLEQTPLIGASGAISAVMGAYLVFFPKAKILTIVGIFPLKILSFFLIIVWFAIQFISFLHTNPEVDGNSTAWLAHIGGFIFGLLFGLIVRIFKAPPEIIQD